MNVRNGQKKLYDISMKITPDMPVYKGHPAKKPVFHEESNFETGTAYETKLEFNLHTGTHIDRSLHMIPGGETVETLPLEDMITECKVFDFTHVNEKITREHLQEKAIAKGDFVLLKTRNSFENILEKDFVYLDKTGAAYLQEQQIKGVGIDALGIERAQPDHETHILLLGSRIVIIEGLRLREIEEGSYMLMAVPILIEGVEAAPVRAILSDL